MRITARVATAGVGGFMQLPILPEDATYYTDGHGHLDEAKARQTFAGMEQGVTLASDDDSGTIALGIEFLDCIKEAMRRMMADTKSVRNVTHEDGRKKTSAERRFRRGKFAYARVDIHRCGYTTFRAKVSATNPRDVTGDAEEFARIYAQSFADNLVALADAHKDEQGLRIEIVEGEGCEGIVEQARKRNDEHALRNKYWDCPNRRNGYCSPTTFDCPLYKAGRCNWK